MDLALRPEEPLPAGLRRLAAQQLERALDQLLAGGNDREKGIHEARKALKRLRALVCLLRAELGPEQMRWEHRNLGHSARLLAGARDAAALRECLDALQVWSHRSFPQVQVWLAQRQGAAAQPGVLAEVADRLRWSQIRLEAWPLREEGWGALGPGLRWVYGRGRQWLRRARADGEAEAFHTWRRYAKYWWYQTQMLQGLWPAMLGVLQAELDRTGELLGADHDLTVLGQVLAQEWPARRARTEVREVVALIPRRQAQLRAEALVLGARLYAESPAALARRFGRYWAGWRSPAASDF